MDFGFEGFESGFTDFDVDVEEVEVKKFKKFDRVWKWSIGGSVSFHIQHNGIAFFSSMDCHMYAVDIEKGILLWKFRTNDRIFGTPSEVVNGRIAVADFGGYTYLINAMDGSEIWRYKTGGPIAEGPTLTKERIFVGSKDGSVYCLDIEGNLKWRFKTGDEIICPVTLQKGNAYFGGLDGHFYCIDAETGKEIWKFKTGDEIISTKSCLIIGKNIYFGSFDNYFYCLDIETGKERWRFRAGKFGIDGASAYGDGTILFPTRGGIVFAISLEGEEKWRFRAGDLVLSVTVNEGKIYIPSEDGNLYVLDKEGKELWRFRFGEGGSYDIPTFYKNKILIGSMDCHFYAINKETGEELWRVGTSMTQRSLAPPPRDEFEVIVKKETYIEDVISEDRYKSKKKEETVSLSDYQIESEYSTTPEYKQKSDYDVNFVIFEGMMEVENIWTSALKVSMPQILKQN